MSDDTSKLVDYPHTKHNGEAGCEGGNHESDFVNPIFRECDENGDVQQASQQTTESEVKSEDDLSSSIGSATDLQEITETRTEVKFLRSGSLGDTADFGELAIQMETLQRSPVIGSSFLLDVPYDRTLEGSQESLVIENPVPSRQDRAPDAEKKNRVSMHRERSLSVYEMEICIDETEERVSWMRDWVFNRTCLYIFLAIIPICVLVLVSVLPASFVYVEYYEIALARSKLTGRVDRQVTYYPGCYLLTPDYEFLRFSSTAHHLARTLEVITSDQIAIRLNVSLQYYINGDEVGLLYAKYGAAYDSIIHSAIINELKTAASHTSLRDFRLERAKIERTIFEDLSNRLQGSCCPVCCPKRCRQNSFYREINCSTCQASPQCDFGLNLKMRSEHFQMGSIEIDHDLETTYLQIALLQIEAEKERYLQEFQVETKLTEELVKRINNEANEILSHASARSKKIKVLAEATADHEIQRSFTKAMGRLFSRWNVTRQEYKLSLMMMFAMNGMPHAFISDFSGLSLS